MIGLAPAPCPTCSQPLRWTRHHGLACKADCQSCPPGDPFCPTCDLRPPGKAERPYVYTVQHRTVEEKAARIARATRVSRNKVKR